MGQPLSRTGYFGTPRKGETVRKLIYRKVKEGSGI